MAVTASRMAPPNTTSDRAPVHDPMVTPRDRMSFALFLTVSLHAGLILGIGFTWHSAPQPSPTIEITLAQHNDVDEPDHADFLAQANQLGSGDLTEVKETTTSEDADFHQDVVQDVLREAQPDVPEDSSTGELALLTTVSAAADEAPEEEASDPTDSRPTLQSEYQDLAREIASLDARLALSYQIEAKAPRVRRLTSVSARRIEDAYYLQSWRRKVEAVGNLNYPAEARTHRLYGSLRMLVSITPDGGLKEVRILESSGHKVLDDAALRIVRLAAPYAPFPPKMRKNTDILEIIRTWQFRKNRYTSS